MNTKKLLSIVIVILSVTACNHNHEEAQEPAAAKLYAKTREFADLWFHHSAEMNAIYIQTYKLAQLALEKQLMDYTFAQKPAVVLDLDETVLDNSPYQFKLIEQQKEYTYESWTEWVNLARAKALPGALEFIEFATEKKVEVFYISNRTVEHLQPTIKNLQALGFPNADSAHLLLREKTSNKTARREKVSENYEIVLFIGDNLTDFSHDFAKRSKETMGKETVDQNKKLFGEKYIILPNPMYGEWEKAIYNNSHKWTEEQKDSLRVLVMSPGY